jgi:hypothetical protein
MNTTVKTILGITLLAIAVAVILVGGGLITGYMPGAVPMAAGGSGGAGFEFGGYLILTLINVALGSVVVWMLVGKTE